MSFNAQQPNGFVAPNKTIQKRGMRSLTNYQAIPVHKEYTPTQSDKKGTKADMPPKHKNYTGANAQKKLFTNQNEK